MYRLDSTSITLPETTYPYVDVRFVATTDAEAWELYRRMQALMGRPVDTGIKEHAQLGNQPTLEVKP